ncbi:GNAT family N-acetyltransferase [Streptomyces sp. NPDC058232]|uniref:GNAT family N-acetyltransferase n=1 Tax=unclassified Streptomyces TaxID=2593676 RepID=UPI0036E735B3
MTLQHIDVCVRRANLDDVPALVRMRALMLSDMGMQTGDADAPWRAASALWFSERLRLPDEFAAFLVTDPELGVVASAVGACDVHAPSPADPSGLHGHISNVSTDPRRRRRGYARAGLDALLTWFREETPVTVINLNATGDGAGLYESFGFAAPRHPALQLRTGA